MATSTEYRDCPNCGVTEETALCSLTTGWAGGDEYHDLVCAVCFRDISLVSGSDPYPGDELTPEEVAERAAAELRMSGWTEDAIAATELVRTPDGAPRAP